MTAPHPATPPTRTRILDALEQRLLTAGGANVTLEDVAADAHVSKGGLLYHFPTKESMLAALIRRLGDRANAQLAEAVAGGTSIAQWYLQTPDDSDETEVALYRSLIAALRSLERRPPESPRQVAAAEGVGPDQGDTLREAVTEVMRAWDAGLRAEIDDPVQAEIVRLVGDGLFFAGLLGLPQPDPELHRKVVERLLGAES